MMKEFVPYRSTRVLLWAMVWGLLSTCPLQAQHITDMTLDSEFAFHVKSTEEFMHRFNGEEAYPGLNRQASDFLRKNIYSLLDRGMPTALKNEADEFVSCILSNNVRLHFCDSSWFACIKCNVTYKGKAANVTLLLRPECHDGKKRRWAFFGAQNLLGGLLPKGKTSIISPVENEIGFAQLGSVFKFDLSNLTGYMADNTEYDQLSAFLALMQAGTLTFNYVTDVSFTFLQVPGYVFSIREVGRRGNNSGWLITDFKKMTIEEKSSYIHSLTGKTIISQQPSL